MHQHRQRDGAQARRWAGRGKLVAVDVEAELVKNAEWDDYLGEFSSTARQAQVRETEILEEGTSFEARLASKPSLDGHLGWQMRLSHFTDLECAIGEAISTTSPAPMASRRFSWWYRLRPAVMAPMEKVSWACGA